MLLAPATQLPPCLLAGGWGEERDLRPMYAKMILGSLLFAVFPPLVVSVSPSQGGESLAQGHKEASLPRSFVVVEALLALPVPHPCPWAI